MLEKNGFLFVLNKTSLYVLKDGKCLYYVDDVDVDFDDDTCIKSYLDGFSTQYFKRF